jgi:hypothetical protein
MEKYSLIGPDVFMDPKGKLYKKAGDDYAPLKNKYTEAEDRFVEKYLKEKGRDWND